jgi:hypothetical protein
MDTGGSGEASQPAPAVSNAMEGGGVDLAKAVAGIHGPICVWHRAGLCSAPWHCKTKLPQTALHSFMPFAVGVSFSDNCTNKILSLCNMCFLLVNPEVPVGQQALLFRATAICQFASSLPVVTWRCGLRHQVGSSIRCLYNLPVEFFHCLFI